jgi:hypothetical protein
VESTVRATTRIVMAGMIAALLSSVGREPTASAGLAAAAACSPARVQYTQHPRVDAELGRLPWIQTKPARIGLVGLIWYWPTEWRQARVRPARIFPGGMAPAGYSTKILWTFIPRSGWAAAGARLAVRGVRLDAAGGFSQEFGGISFTGQRGPAYASIVDVPEPGCWRLELSSGALHASVVLLAVKSTP